ncbi:O-methyltransferase [Ramlibacter sp. MAHUQ-53]|uniref:O-methyltransferase n=1 Tax=unclassified Ramlibacter TaxID=2617605 RepID=UPI00363E0A98
MTRIQAAPIVCKSDDKAVEELVKGWEFYATTDAPHRLDLPALSTLDRLTMESNINAKTMMGLELPRSDMVENAFEIFDKFYRIFPHFSRVEL